MWTFASGGRYERAAVFKDKVLGVVDYRKFEEARAPPLSPNLAGSDAEPRTKINVRSSAMDIRTRNAWSKDTTRLGNLNWVAS